MATLKDAKIGQTVRVKKLTGEGAVKRRIMDMGITKGQLVLFLDEEMNGELMGFQLHYSFENGLEYWKAAE